MGIEKNIIKLPLLTQGLILDEIYYNPKFAGYIKPLLAKTNPYKGIFLDIKKVLENEIAPNKFPETAGKWNVLRSRAKSILEGIASKHGLSGVFDFLKDINVTQLLTETVIPQAISHFTASQIQANAQQEQAQIALAAAQASAAAAAAGTPPPPPPPPPLPPASPSVYYPAMRDEQQKASQGAMMEKYLPYIIAGGGGLVVLLLALNTIRR